MTPADPHKQFGPDGAGTGATRWVGMSGRAERLRHVRSCCHRKQRSRRPARHEGSLVLTREEQRRFDELVRQIDQETATGPAPETAAATPVRRTKLAVFLIGMTGVLTGLATDDLLVIVMAMVGVATTVIAAILFAFAGTPGPAPAPPTRSADGKLEQDMSLLMRLWLWLTTCEENGCSKRPVHQGWCSEHAPDHTPRPDEYWGEYWDDPESDRR
jgi:hypothetical protein